MNVTNNHDHFKSLDGTNIFKFTTIHPVWDRFRPFWELISQTKGTESTKLDSTFSRNPESEPITSEDKNNWRKPEANDPIKFTEHHWAGNFSAWAGEATIIERNYINPPAQQVWGNRLTTTVDVITTPNQNVPRNNTPRSCFKNMLQKEEVWCNITSYRLK